MAFFNKKKELKPQSKKKGITLNELKEDEEYKDPFAENGEE